MQLKKERDKTWQTIYVMQQAQSRLHGKNPGLCNAINSHRALGCVLMFATKHVSVLPALDTKGRETVLTQPAVGSKETKTCTAEISRAETCSM